MLSAAYTTFYPYFKFLGEPRTSILSKGGGVGRGLAILHCSTSCYRNQSKVPRAVSQLGFRDFKYFM